MDQHRLSGSFIFFLFSAVIIIHWLFLALHSSAYWSIDPGISPSSSLLADSGDVWYTAGGLAEFKVSYSH